MTVLAGLVGMVGVLLAAGGVSKALQPAPTVRSFRAVGLPAAPVAVRSLAVVEVLLGVMLVGLGGRWPSLAAALLFGGFTVISVRLMRLGADATSCGCFGDRSARPSWIHVLVDAAAAVVLAIDALTATSGLARHWTSLPGQGFVVLGLIGLGGYLLVALMTVLPDTAAAIRGDDLGSGDGVAVWTPR